MKSLYLTFDDAEFDKMEKIKIKSGMGWKEFLKAAIKEYVEP